MRSLTKTYTRRILYLGNFFYFTFNWHDDYNLGLAAAELVMATVIEQTQTVNPVIQAIKQTNSVVKTKPTPEAMDTKPKFVVTTMPSREKDSLSVWSMEDATEALRSCVKCNYVEDPKEDRRPFMRKPKFLM